MLAVLGWELLEVTRIIDLTKQQQWGWELHWNVVHLPSDLKKHDTSA